MVGRQGGRQDVRVCEGDGEDVERYVYGVEQIRYDW